MDNAMHIVLAADDNYARPLAVTIMSVLCNAEKNDVLQFHVLDGGIRPENRRRISSMVAASNTGVDFLSVSARSFSGMSLNIRRESHVTPATYYRLLLPSLINASRCIYMDCDMICRSGLRPLWEAELGQSLAGAVKDIDEDRHSARLSLARYFNTGLMLMNLEDMRRENIQQQFFLFIKNEHERIVMHDQDVLNCVLHDRIHELDMTWNCQITKTHKCRETGFYDLSKTARILHFIGHKKPWIWRCKTPERKIFWTYLQKTPWKENFLCNALRRVAY